MRGSLQQAEPSIYGRLEFGQAHRDRPYTLIDMIVTIDGKSVTGTREESVADLGSPVDHASLRALESSVDAVLVGAATLRATSPRWQPRSPNRITLSASGRLDFSADFFTGGEAFLAGSEVPPVGLPPHIRFLAGCTKSGDLLRTLRDELGIERLLILGGSETNAQFLRDDLVDELFLTIAPKVKLGRNLPTFAGGEPIPREQMLAFRLLEHHVADDEVFLRYRRRGEGE